MQVSRIVNSFCEAKSAFQVSTTWRCQTTALQVATNTDARFKEQMVSMEMHVFIFKRHNLYWVPVSGVHLYNWFEWRRLNAQNDELVVTRQSLVAEQSFVEQIAGDAVFTGRIRFPCAAQIFAHLLTVDVDAMPNEFLWPSKMRKEFRYPGNQQQTMGPRSMQYNVKVTMFYR